MVYTDGKMLPPPTVRPIFDLGRGVASTRGGLLFKERNGHH
jgi:hypothetical protein